MAQCVVCVVYVCVGVCVCVGAHVPISSGCALVSSAVRGREYVCL